MRILTSISPWAGLVVLSPILLDNAFGMLDQSVAARELVASGAPPALAGGMIWFGRVLQLVATPCLFFRTTRPYAGLALAIFLIGATMTAHAFWKALLGDRD